MSVNQLERTKAIHSYLRYRINRDGEQSQGTTETSKQNSYSACVDETREGKQNDKNLTINTKFSPDLKHFSQFCMSKLHSQQHPVTPCNGQSK